MGRGGGPRRVTLPTIHQPQDQSFASPENRELKKRSQKFIVAGEPQAAERVLCRLRYAITKYASTQADGSSDHMNGHSSVVPGIRSVIPFNEQLEVMQSDGQPIRRRVSTRPRQNSETGGDREPLLVPNGGHDGGTIANESLRAIDKLSVHETHILTRIARK